MSGITTLFNKDTLYPEEPPGKWYAEICKKCDGSSLIIHVQFSTSDEAQTLLGHLEDFRKKGAQLVLGINPMPSQSQN